LKLAYADPPYLGMGKKMYGKLHSEAAIWDEKETHLKLMLELEKSYDGWALSCNPKDLKWLLPAAPEDSRIAVWLKPFANWRPTYRVQYTWESVIFKPSRPKVGYKEGINSVRDHLVCNIALKKGLSGAKPDLFNDWILELLNFEIGDDVNDLFPGTNGIAEAIARVESRLL
jgi:hypothetical protein